MPALLQRPAPQGVFPSRAFNGLSLPGGMYGLMEWRPPAGDAGSRGRGQGEASLNVLKVGAGVRLCGAAFAGASCPRCASGDYCERRLPPAARSSVWGAASADGLEAGRRPQG